MQAYEFWNYIAVNGLPYVSRHNDLTYTYNSLKHVDSYDSGTNTTSQAQNIANRILEQY